MSCEAQFRRWSLTGATALLVLPHLAAAADTPRKPAAARRSFDFGRPQPGEILANPARASGAAPSLAQFAPAAAMSPPRGGPGGSTPEAAAGQREATGGAVRSSAQITAQAAPPPFPIGVSQAALASRIARLGIEGALASPPANARSAGGRGGDALLDQLRRSFADVRSSSSEPERIQTPRPGESLDVKVGR